MSVVASSFTTFADSWRTAFQEHGVTPHQSPDHIRAELDRPDTFTVVLGHGGVFSAFRVKGATAVCLVEGAGVLQTRREPFDGHLFLTFALAQLGVKAIHMPLLYRDLPCAQILLNVRGGSQLNRRPTPVFGPPFDADIVLARAATRIGSQALRRVDHFTKAGLSFRELAPGPAIAALDRIERRSWKAQYAQDMRSRNQFDAYAARLWSRELTLTAAMAADEAIAYRIDCHIGHVLFALKWSFDEAWRRVSPGFLLLAIELPQRCAALNVRLVDLFGSPDTLKDAISTDSRDRVDLVWPRGPIANDILAERQLHDQLAARSHAQGQGIRNAYARFRQASQ